jgi:type IV pilus assembly protein PilN
MTHINLLPWRASLQEERKKQFIAFVVLAAAASLLMVIIMHTLIAGQIEYQRSVNSLLTQAISQLDVKIKEVKDLQEQKARLIAHMNIIDGLQTNRPQVVHVFDELVRIAPSSVYLLSAKREGETITLTGRAESNTAISTLMRNIEKSAWLSSPTLSEITTDPAQVPYSNNFTLQLSVKPKS